MPPATGQPHFTRADKKLKTNLSWVLLITLSALHYLHLLCVLGVSAYIWLSGVEISRIDRQTEVSQRH